MEPPFYGTLLNNLQWKRFSMSFNMSFKANYFFKSPVTSPIDLFKNWRGGNDFSSRWKQPGDELTTNVPSLVYSNDPNFIERHSFYRASEIVVEKADQVRLEDINISYLIINNGAKKVPFKQLSISAFFNGLNILIWRVILTE
jgi:hypothetical protein